MKRYNKIIFSCLVLFFVFTILLAFVSIPSGALEVHFFDIGQGDAIFIRTPSGNSMLIDGGPDADVIAHLGKVLPFWRRRIDLVAATHMDADHIGGLMSVLEHFNVGGVIVSYHDENTDLSNAFWDKIDQYNIPVFIAERGDLFRLDNEVQLLTISPTAQLREFASDNDKSLIFKLTYKNDSFLLTGDAERRAELNLLADNINLNADVLKIGHHGSNSSSIAGFLKSVASKLAVIQVGQNRFGHPHNAVLERLSGTKILRNDLNGDIILYSYGDSF